MATSKLENTFHDKPGSEWRHNVSEASLNLPV